MVVLSWRWIFSIGGEPKYWEGNLSSVALSTRNVTWISLGSNLGLHSERPVKNCLKPKIQLNILKFSSCIPVNIYSRHYKDQMADASLAARHLMLKVLQSFETLGTANTATHLTRLKAVVHSIYKNIITVYFENHTKHISRLYGRQQCLWMLHLVVRGSYCCALKV